MALTQRLELRQSQSLVMTPQLQQAIKLLQLSNIELGEFVEAELETNPLLDSEERRAGEAEDPVSEASLGEDRASSDDREAALAGDSASLADSDQIPDDANAPLDTDPGDLYDLGPGDGYLNAAPGGAGPGVSGFDELPSLEQRLSETVTLRQHLLDQLTVELSDPVDRLIGVHLIDMLDEAGYLTGSPEELAGLLGCPEARVEAVLATLQGFDPAGIFARSLQECLAIQLAERDRLDPAMQALIDNLDLLARHELPRLMRRCGVDAEDMAEMIAEIRQLDPKPAQAFDHQAAETVIPDILLFAKPDGGWRIELNPETLPRVLVNRSYHAQVQAKARTRPEREYLAERLQQANWLVKALHQRATTILKVATEIVRQQSGFFQHGVEHLRPLTLRDIAEKVELHESTVSRVTSNKYMATPRGTFELKYFFTAAIAGLGRESHSAESVRHRIRALIDQESPDRVLSDDTIVTVLQREGIDIARRTVAKYREALRIPSSVQRRREKRALRK
ncbi:MAG: RNA polymerase factor sigma-54 [Kiloniellales bacterium]|nr:RNA polymerase factor sigma-54 [Kiloniellales bacterium]